ncbi:hypothetical protein CASFOL_006299 [Castilleja foliolosa]|uniref:Protein LAZY 1-like n=1 Tax=Castilleja foliolosa TaxID=1961234 RepID=A0ABD3E630_9LAMI
MKLLGWMHRKLRQNTHDTTPPNDFPIGFTGQSTLDDLQCYQNENYGSKPFGKAQRDNNRSSFARVEHEEDDIAELFHGFLAIGTLGTEQLFTTTDPAATPTFDHMIAEKETEVTENEFKQINDELEKVLGDDVSSGRNSKVSTDQKPNTESADTCPLQSYLFGSKIGDAETTTPTTVRKEQRTSLGELFEKTKEAEDNNSHVTKSVSDKSAVHVMKKMLKKKIHVHSSSKSSTGGAKIGCTATDKKLHKILHIFNRKVHPENPITANYEQTNKPLITEKEMKKKKNGDDQLDSWDSGSLRPSTGDIIIYPQHDQAAISKQSMNIICNNNNNPSQLIINNNNNNNGDAAADATGNEFWVKTDAHYLYYCEI